MITDNPAQQSSKQPVDNYSEYKPENPRSRVNCNEIKFANIEKNVTGLLKHVEEYSDLVDELNNELPRETKQLKRIILDFNNFFSQYFDYFKDKKVKELYSKQMSCECVLSTALFQANAIWVNITWAVNQRFISIYKTRLTELADYVDNWIDRSGGLVSEKHKKLEQKPIIYFDKVVRITRYPYLASPLLGTKFILSDKEQELSLAHEFGHYIFWNSGDLDDYNSRIKNIYKLVQNQLKLTNNNLNLLDNDDKSAVSKEVQNRLNMYRILTGWLEEIFADIYGTLLLGPSFAKSAQDMLISNVVGTTNDFFYDDGEHPMPYIRPYISLVVLKKMYAHDDNIFKSNESVSTVYDLLRERWDNISSQKMTMSIEQKNLMEHLKSIVSDIMEMGDKLLLTEVTYWGSDDTNYEGEIKTLIREIENEERIIIPIRIDGYPEQGNYNSQDENFKKFLKFVQQNGDENTPVWRKVLYLRMTNIQHANPCFRRDDDGKRERC